MSFSWVSGDPIPPQTLRTGPCHYGRHRDTWWRRLLVTGRGTAGGIVGSFMGPIVCGICHPPLGVPAEEVMPVDHHGEPR